MKPEVFSLDKMFKHCLKASKHAFYIIVKPLSQQRKTFSDKSIICCWPVLSYVKKCAGLKFEVFLMNSDLMFMFCMRHTCAYLRGCRFRPSCFPDSNLFWNRSFAECQPRLARNEITENVKNMQITAESRERQTQTKTHKSKLRSRFCKLQNADSCNKRRFFD